MSRILTALVAVPVLLAVILAGPVWLFLALGIACALIAYCELGTLARKAGWELLPAGYAGVAALVLSFYPGSFPLESVVLALVLLLGLASVATRGPSRETLGAIAATSFAVLYVGACLGSVVGLRSIAPDREGRLWVIFLLAVVFIGDAAAFYTGRTAGKRPLAPVLSPKKTVEGLVGGFAGSILTALALRHWTFPHVAWEAAFGLGLSLAVLGVSGDLFESLLKRSVGAKDASALLPGHGGMLDRIDSVLFAAPALYLYAKWASGT
jgi:phosphatidate cytidylyltransferase